MEIIIPATVRKDQNAKLGELNGCANSVPLTLENQTVGVGRVMFRGFDWLTFEPGRKFGGNLVFSTDVPDGTPRADLNALFETKTTTSRTKAAKAKKATVTDGNKSDE